MKPQTGSILILDPHSDTNRELSDWLTEQGHTVTTAGNQRRSFDLLSTQPIDLIVFDVSIPKKQGRQFLKKLKSEDTLSHIPVLITAEPAKLERVLEYIELGAEDYLFKPLDPTLAQIRLANNLEKKQLRDHNRLMEASLQAAKIEQSKFVPFVAHELRTPLTSVKGYADLIKKGALGPISEAQAGFLNTIVNNADRMADLITNLNDITRIEAQRLRVDFEDADINEVIAKVVRAFGDKISQKEQTLTLQVPEGLPSVWADPTRLNQILTSLLNNAHKYTPEQGQIILSVEHQTKQNEPAAHGLLQVTIRDNGYGISEADQPKVFEKFFRSDDPQIQEVAGAGLGLHLARRLVEIHGGRLWFESEHGQGSTFCFTLPIDKSTKR
jgi:signal transduction histidine kinase